MDFLFCIQNRFIPSGINLVSLLVNQFEMEAERSRSLNQTNRYHFIEIRF
jgi:hypothetical protein